MLKPYIKAALTGDDLSEAAAQEAMGIVMSGEATDAQIAAWLVALRQKGETTHEIVGFVHAMRSAMVPLGNAPSGAIDTCGTGGDGLGTFNISTAAALIAAASDVPVAKHGNCAVSSRSGSADVLVALGFDIDPGAPVVLRALAECGFAFLFAPRFHPAMRHAAAARREIGVRTVFNILGPLCNPARVKRQVIGIYDPGRLLQMAEVIAQLGAERALVVCGPGHADELLPTGDNQVAEWDGHAVRCYRLCSEDVGLPTHPPEALAGGDADDNARDILSIAHGRNGPKCDTALLNAGAALYVGGSADSVADGIALARNAVAEGRLADLVTRAASASHGRFEQTG